MRSWGLYPDEPRKSHKDTAGNHNSSVSRARGLGAPGEKLLFSLPLSAAVLLPKDFPPPLTVCVSWASQSKTKITLKALSHDNQSCF